MSMYVLKLSGVSIPFVIDYRNNDYRDGILGTFFGTDHGDDNALKVLHF